MKKETQELIEKFKEAGFNNIFIEVTAEEVIQDEMRLYNPSAWKERVTSLMKYENTKFYKQGDKFYGIYTTEDGIRRMLEIQYSQMLCNGLLREYYALDLKIGINLRLLTPKGMGIDQSVKGVKQQMKELSKQNHIFTKAI